MDACLCPLTDPSSRNLTDMIFDYLLDNYDYVTSRDVWTTTTVTSRDVWTTTTM